MKKKILSSMGVLVFFLIAFGYFSLGKYEESNEVIEKVYISETEVEMENPENDIPEYLRTIDSPIIHIVEREEYSEIPKQLEIQLKNVFSGNFLIDDDKSIPVNEVHSPNTLLPKEVTYNEWSICDNEEQLEKQCDDKWLICELRETYDNL